MHNKLSYRTVYKQNTNTKLTSVLRFALNISDIKE